MSLHLALEDMDVRMLAEILDAETAARREQVGVLGAFAALALLLAA